MNISGIVIGLAPLAFDPGLAALGALPGVHLHHLDRAGSRVVVTQEAASTDAQEAGLRQIQALPGVVHAELVYHYFDEGSDDGPAPVAAAEAALVQLGRPA